MDILKLIEAVQQARAAYGSDSVQYKEALCDFMHIMAFKLKEAEEAELNQRAKDLVIKGLKGEQV